MMPEKPPISPPSANAETTLVPLLISISKSMRQLVSLKLADSGVAAGQDQFLLCFDQDEALSVAGVADRLGVRASTVSKMADRLESKGWIARSPATDDARRVHIRLLDTGRKVQDTVRAIECRLEVELLVSLGNDKGLISSLSKLDAVLVKRLSRLR